MSYVHIFIPFVPFKEGKITEYSFQTRASELKYNIYPAIAPSNEAIITYR